MKSFIIANYIALCLVESVVSVVCIIMAFIGLSDL